MTQAHQTESPGMESRTSIGIVHVHTSYSHDGKDSIADLAAWARDVGIQFVSITDHAEDFDTEKWSALVAECAEHSDQRLHLFPGLEFRFAGFTGVHLLACGLREFISPETPEAFIREATPRCTLTIGAHPVIWRKPCPPDVLASLHAVEVWNGGYNSRFLPDPKAFDMVARLRASGTSTLATVGPDQHDRRKDPHLRIRADAAAPDALDAIRAGRYVSEGMSMRVPSDGNIGFARRAALGVGRLTFDVAKRSRDRYLASKKR